MNIRRIATLVWGLIVIVAASNLPLAANIGAIASPERTAAKFTPQQEEIVKQIQAAKVIYLGETHDRDGDRLQQLAILRRLAAKNPKLAIGMEMFQRQTQPLLDRYLAGKITSEQLRVQSEFDRRWGYPWASYAQILEFAKANRLPVTALNVPTEITRKVSKQGLESLTPTELQYIPPVSEIDRSNTTYRDLIMGSFQQHMGIVSHTNRSFDRFYTAQLLWDETMADRVANFVKQNPDRQKIVIAGQSHIIYGYGIPDRVKRRMGSRPFSQKTVLLSNEGVNLQPPPADFIWDGKDK